MDAPAPVPPAAHLGPDPCDRSAILAAAIVGLLLTLQIMIGLEFGSGTVSCDRDMHSAAVLRGMQALEQGILWPYVPELHLGWASYGLYSWPLFCLLAAGALLLNTLGDTEAIDTTLLLAGHGACAVTILAAALFARSTVRWHAQQGPGWQRDLATVLGAVIATCFLNLPYESWHGFGSQSVFNAGLIAQGWGWPALLLLGTTSMRLLQAPPASRARARWLALTAVRAAALFAIHTQSAIVGLLWMLGLIVLQPGQRWALLGAAGAAGGLVAPYLLILLGHTGMSAPTAHIAEHHDALAHLLAVLVLSLATGMWSVSLSISLFLGASCGALRAAWRGGYPGATWAVAALLPLAAGLMTLWAQWLPLAAHWYRLSAPALLLIAVCGAGLLSLPLSRRWARPSRQREGLLAALGMLVVLVFAAGHTFNNPTRVNANFVASMDAEIRSRVDPQTRWPAFIAGHHRGNHLAARLAVELPRDLACGAHTATAGPAYQALVALLRRADLAYWGMTTDPFAYPLTDDQLASCLQDLGASGLISDRLPQTERRLRAQERRFRTHLPGWQHTQTDMIHWWRAPSAVPLISPLPLPLLTIAPPREPIARFALGAWWLDWRARSGDQRRLVLRAADSEADNSSRFAPPLQPAADRPQATRPLRALLSGNKQQVIASRLIDAWARFEALEPDLDERAPVTDPPTRDPATAPTWQWQPDRLLIDDLEPGRPYLLRWNHSPFFQVAEAALYEEASGFMVLIPTATSCALVFAPLARTGWYPSLLLSGLTAIVLLLLMVGRLPRPRNDRADTRSPSHAGTPPRRDPPA